MELILRKRLTGDLIRVSRAKTLRCGSRKLAYVEPCSGQWIFHALGEPGSSNVRYNRRPAPSSCPMEVGDLLDLDGVELVVDSVEAAPGELPTPAIRAAAPELSGEAREEIATPSPSGEIDCVYRKAKSLCQRLLPVLRDPGRTFQVCGASSIGIWGWLRFLFRPSSPAETLDRLELFLSGSPRDRVWLVELSRFLFQQSFYGLCLRVVKELCRLHPQDGELLQTLAKIYYQQGRNPHLQAIARLNAFEGADKYTHFARRLMPADDVLAELQKAIRREQTTLRHGLLELAPCGVALEDNRNAMGRGV